MSDEAKEGQGGEFLDLIKQGNFKLKKTETVVKKPVYDESAKAEGAEGGSG
jgi:hypothetical protein